MDICVIGAGYVGLVTSCCLAYLGNKVIVVESNKSRLDELKKGMVPFFEPGLNELLEFAVASQFLRFTDSIEQGVKQSTIIFIAVGTPALPSGEPDLSQVVTVARTIGSTLDSAYHRLIINKSTVPVGSGNWVEMLVQQGLQVAQAVPAGNRKAERPCFNVISNPEFLREGTAISDTFYPDRIIIGATDEHAVEIMHNLYKPIIDQTFEPPTFIPRPLGLKPVPFVVTDLASAEMIKYSANAFLALKISFANEISLLCEKVGADITQVTKGIGLDKRIGTAFLNAGIGWGGSCFGKDVHALIEVAKEYNCHTALLEATISVNKHQRVIAITKLQEELKILKGRTIGLMGLSFKPNTDDLRDAPSLTIASQLQRMGVQVKAYDPVSTKACAKAHPELHIVYCQNVSQLALNADALVLVTEWDEFLKINWTELAALMKHPIVIDGRNFLPEAQLKQAGFTYRGIGH